MLLELLPSIISEQFFKSKGFPCYDFAFHAKIILNTQSHYIFHVVSTKFPLFCMAALHEKIYSASLTIVLFQKSPNLIPNTATSTLSKTRMTATSHTS